MTTVIIGAGMAGLSAARLLADHGHEPIVLEAAPRCGGRLHTVQLGAATVDLGGAWIHGTDANPLTELASQAGVAGSEGAFADNPAGLQAVTAAGDVLDPVEFARGALAFWVSIEQGDAESDRRASATAPELLGAAAAEQAGYRWAREVGLTSLEAADLDDLGLDAFDYEDRPGAQLLLTEGGYGPMVEHLADGLDIRLSHPVERVSRAPGGHFVSGPWGQLHATRVIVTVSIGVLQQRGIDFEPPLPSDVDDAIGSIGMGHVEKVALAFERAPWPPGVRTLAVADTEADDAFANWTMYPDAPIAVSYGGGERGRRLGSMRDDDALSQALDRLETIFGALPALTGWTRSHWTHDPYIRGAYSFNPSTDARSARARLAEPVRTGLRFAGEALSAHDYGTAHSALLSGRTVAQLIIDELE